MTAASDPDCAILIPTRNREGLLSETLTRLRGAGLSHLPLWLYDDASDDADMVRRVADRHWSGATVIRDETRRGQAYGRNALLRRCNRRYAILLDDDQYFVRVGSLHDYMRPRETARAVLCFQCRDKTDGRLDIPEIIRAGRTSSFMGGAVMFDVGAVLEVGGYREHWGYGYEEPELAMRLFARGQFVWYEPDIMVEHNHVLTADAARDDAQYDFYYARNAILLSSLNMPLWLGLPTGLLRSVRRSLYIARNPAPKLKGTLSGIITTFSRWKDRTPMRAGQAFAWMTFRKKTLQQTIDNDE